MQELNEWDSFYKEFQEKKRTAARNSALKTDKAIKEKAARKMAKMLEDRRKRLKRQMELEIAKEERRAAKKARRIEREAALEAERAFKKYKREAKQKKIDDSAESVVNLALTTSMNADEMSERFGIEKVHIHEILHENLTENELLLRKQIVLSGPKPKMTKYTDDDIVDAIKMASEELGPKFGAVRYANWRNSKPKRVRDKIPSQALFQRRKGWRKYREMAGLETPHIKIEGMGVRTYTDEDIFRALDSLVEKKGRWIKLEEAEAMTKDKAKIPKVGIMRIRFGSWEKVRKAYFESRGDQ
jgi:hypothetical protein